MTEERELSLREEDYYDLLSFLVSSALLLSQGEQDMELYPSLRLMDGASRLTKAIITNGGFENQAWPHDFVEACGAAFDTLGIDDEAFVRFLTEATQGLAEEMKRRARDG